MLLPLQLIVCAFFAWYNLVGVFSGSRPTFVYGLAVCIYHGCVCLCANDDVGMIYFLFFPLD